MLNTGKHLIGNKSSNLIQPENITHVITSPRLRATQTRDLLLKTIDESNKRHITVETDESLREWEYGDYEGLLTSQIIELRKKRGLEPGADWNIWRDGCENGETSDQVAARVDSFIAKVQKIQKEYLENEKTCDIVIVAHGHILRCLAARWISNPINKNPQFMLDAGGVGVLSYQHHCIEEPALFLAGAFVVPDDEQGSDL